MRWMPTRRSEPESLSRENSRTGWASSRGFRRESRHDRQDVALPRAERRRAELLKAAGFNAVRSAHHDVRIVLDPDRTRLAADPADATFIGVELRDTRRVVHTATDRTVHLTVTGPGALAGFGSADPRTTEPFTADRCMTYEGRALAVVRPTGTPGVITILATAKALGATAIEVMTG